MEKIKLDYIEIDGLLYPNIEIGGQELLDSLGKYGILRLRYLHEHKPEMYRELLLTGKLAEHCDIVDKNAFELSERIRTNYLEVHTMPDEDTMERIKLSTIAQAIADEIVLNEFVYC